MKEENLNILSFSENDQKVSAPVDDSEPSLIVALGKIFELISVICEELVSDEKELDNIEKELNTIVHMIDSMDKRLRALEKAKDTQTD